MKHTVFITGASSGLGKLTARHFAAKGWQVAATMRTPEKETELTQLPNVKVFKLDVTQPDQVTAAVNAAIDTFGHIDIVINNAGVGAYGPLEFATEQTINWQFNVNVKGPIHVIQAFLPHFRARQAGMFINISSFMGVTTAVPVGSLYNMSKFALEGLIEGLYYELKPFNIDLRLVEQGGSSGNNFKDAVIWNENPAIPDYDPITNRVKALMDNRNPELLDDPQLIVDTIYSLATRESNQFRTVVGAVGQNLMALRNSMPIEAYLEKMESFF